MHVHGYVHMSVCAQGGLRSDPLELGCWELNSGTLKEQQIFLTTEPSLQTQLGSFLKEVSLVSSGTALADLLFVDTSLTSQSALAID